MKIAHITAGPETKQIIFNEPIGIAEEGLLNQIAILSYH
jgi:hypothetical protein